MQKTSLRKRLIILFTAASLVPILILELYSYYNIRKGLRENTGIMTESNLLQVDNNLNIWLESYEDLLYQIYTADDMVLWTDNLSAGIDEAVTTNQIRRFFSSLLYTKEYIRAITIITPDGDVVTYEQMTPATYKSSWLDNFSLSQDELYSEVIKDYETHIFSTEYATNFASRDYYLFHMAHRIIDYRRLNKECGIAIISIDSDFLDNVCMNPVLESSAFNFLVDERGRVISFGNDNGYVGAQVTDMSRPESARNEDYIRFIKEETKTPVNAGGLYLFNDEKLGWDIVNLADQRSLVYSQKRQLYMFLLLSLLILGSVILVSTGMSRDLISSVVNIVDGMKQAQNGDLSVRIAKDPRRPLEFESIAEGFNDTLSRLNESINRQREAQIVAMEAQINPHFLYNTLDTINWMAIDRDEYDISNAISALANILRYAIVNSNAEVTVREETEWLKKYIYLQQYRLKNQFSCRIDAQPEVLCASIHKLLLQPFVENAILHGFDKNQSDPELKVGISKNEDKLEIEIEDNGTGIDPEILDRISQKNYARDFKGSGIGMKNAITRLEMYYGSRAGIEIGTVSPHGTRVLIRIPYSEKEV